MAALHPRILDHVTRVGLLGQITVIDDRNASFTGSLNWTQLQELERAVSQHGASLQTVAGVLRIVQL